MGSAIPEGVGCLDITLTPDCSDRPASFAWQDLACKTHNASRFDVYPLCPSAPTPAPTPRQCVVEIPGASCPGPCGANAKNATVIYQDEGPSSECCSWLQHCRSPYHPCVYAPPTDCDPKASCTCTSTGSGSYDPCQSWANCTADGGMVEAVMSSLRRLVGLPKGH